MKKINTLVIVLVVLLVLSVGYIVYGQYSSWKQEKDFGNFQAGANYGAQQAVAYLYQQVITCQAVPITDYTNNQTINVIAVECLQNK